MLLKEWLTVGFIQTVVEEKIAWPPPPPYQFSEESEERVWAELRKGFSDLLTGNDLPRLIIIPELSVPNGYEYDLRQLAAASGAVVIAGMDFHYLDAMRVCNRATVIVPYHWPYKRYAKGTNHFYFGKTFYSATEEELFSRANLVSQPDIFILHAGEFGNFGIAICSDFFDIERFVVYKGRIHHLVIIAHNQDTESYYFLAEAIARLVYCNVVICNTGEFGDSIAFSPFKDSYKRIIYRHKGSGLFSTQVVSLPVSSLNNEQKDGEPNVEFKSRPPGYRKIEF
jgi:hypothetical protein